MLVPSAWINPCYRINLIHIASLIIFKTMCRRRSINIIEQSELGIRQRSMLIVFDYCLYESESGRIIDVILYVYICLYLNFAFSKTKMFKLLFILFVIKQLLGNLILGYQYLFSQGKYYLTRGSQVVVILIETLHITSILIFTFELKDIQLKDIWLMVLSSSMENRQATMEKLIYY